jgi:hypothetical protein
MISSRQEVVMPARYGHSVPRPDRDSLKIRHISI